MIRCRSLVLCLMVLVMSLQAMAMTALPHCAAAATDAQSHPHAAMVDAAAVADQQHAPADSSPGQPLRLCCSLACSPAVAMVMARWHVGEVRPAAPWQTSVQLFPGVVLDRLDRPPQF